jgi:hypothetical protein
MVGRELADPLRWGTAQDFRLMEMVLKCSAARMMVR